MKLVMYAFTAGGVAFFIALFSFYYEYCKYLYRRDSQLKDSAKEARNVK